MSEDFEGFGQEEGGAMVGGGWVERGVEWRRGFEAESMVVKYWRGLWSGSLNPVCTIYKFFRYSGLVLGSTDSGNDMLWLFASSAFGFR